MKALIFSLCFLLYTPYPVEASQDILLASTARTATNSTANRVKGLGVKSLHLILNVTVVPGGDTITPKLVGIDALGIPYDLLVGAAISTTGTTVLKLGQGVGLLANGSAQDLLPDLYKVTITHSGSGSFTYSLTQNTGN